MSWLSSIFSPRKRSAADSAEEDATFLGTVLKRMKPETPKVEAFAPKIDPSDTLTISTDNDGDIAPLVSSILVPRPLTLVAWKNKQGDLSIIPTSFCSLVSENPAYISIGLEKDSLPEDTSTQAVGRSKEFTVSVVSEWLAKSAARTAGTYELPEDDADLKTGLTTTASKEVNVPIISEAAASLECKIHHKVNIKDSEGEVASIVVIAEVVCIHVNKAVLKNPNESDFIVDVTKLKPVASVGVDALASISNPYELPLANSPPLSPKSPEIREGVFQPSPNTGNVTDEIANTVANAVKEALTQNSEIPSSQNLGDAREELAETVLNAVENILEPERDSQEEDEGEDIQDEVEQEEEK